jgi:ABC-type branched-subunit amino acid transport system substrate-binding protein
MSREYVQGAIMADGFFAESRSEDVQRFVEKFEKTFGEKPGIIEATTFDTASIVFQVLGRDDIRFRSTLKNALMKVRDFPGVTGKTTFNDQGEAIKTPCLLRVKGGRFIELEKR